MKIKQIVLSVSLREWVLIPQKINISPHAKKVDYLFLCFTLKIYKK